ncbi:MAG: hypothetical protein K2N43_01580, partial [Lachnospiraceae bacterium]|nr:hypothetical protein [Lachnospiraceae bacterium]
MSEPDNNRSDNLMEGRESYTDPYVSESSEDIYATPEVVETVEETVSAEVVDTHGLFSGKQPENPDPGFYQNYDSQQDDVYGGQSPYGNPYQQGGAYGGQTSYGQTTYGSGQQDSAYGGQSPYGNPYQQGDAYGGQTSYGQTTYGGGQQDNTYGGQSPYG